MKFIEKHLKGTLGCGQIKTTVIHTSLHPTTPTNNSCNYYTSNYQKLSLKLKVYIINMIKYLLKLYEKIKKTAKKYFHWKFRNIS